MAVADLLIIQIKTFNWVNGKNYKRFDEMYIPTELDLSRFITGVSEQISFKLTSMIIHHGHQAAQGHYSAICTRLQNQDGSSIYHHFNDKSVSRLIRPIHDELKQGYKLVIPRTPYLLFYQKSGIQQDTVPLPESLRNLILQSETDEKLNLLLMVLPISVCIYHIFFILYNYRKLIRIYNNQITFSYYIIHL